MLDQFLWGHSSRVCDISCFKLFYIIINKMKQQITKNEENLFFGEKNAQVSVVTLDKGLHFRSIAFNVDVPMMVLTHLCLMPRSLIHGLDAGLATDVHS